MFGNMTLVIPGPGMTEDGYLIGRASKKETLRVTRMTEVAPTNSSIVDAGEFMYV